MMLDRATCDANHRRFVERIVAQQEVWYLNSPDGPACSSSNDDDGEEEEGKETIVLMFWSDRAYATRVKRNGFESYEETSIGLFDFLFRWLPGMSRDGVLAGTNWTGDLIGVEKDPYELREEIEAMMSDELKESHQTNYNCQA